MSPAYCLAFSWNWTAQILGFGFWVWADSSSSQSVNRVDSVSGFQTVKTWQPGQRLLNLTLTWKWSYLYANFRLHTNEFPACYVGVLHVIKACMPSQRWVVLIIKNFNANFKAFWTNLKFLSPVYVTHHYKNVFLTWTSELGSTGWRLNQCSFPLYLHRSSFRIDTLPEKTKQTRTLMQPQLFYWDRKTYLCKCTYCDLPTGKSLWKTLLA